MEIYKKLLERREIGRDRERGRGGERERARERERMKKRKLRRGTRSAALPFHIPPSNYFFMCLHSPCFFLHICGRGGVGSTEQNKERELKTEKDGERDREIDR